MKNSGKALALAAVLAAAGYSYFDRQGLPGPEPVAPAAAPAYAIREAFRDHRNNIQVEGQGTVKRILPDDREGSRHQRFVLRLDGAQTILVAHNIDLAPRINALREGDVVSFYGEYEWNAKGGVLHWTHRDPHGRHADGWLRHQGRIYQ